MVGHDTKDKGEKIMIECAQSFRLRTETKHYQKSYTVGPRNDFRGQAGQVQRACSSGSPSFRPGRPKSAVR